MCWNCCIENLKAQTTKEDINVYKLVRKATTDRAKIACIIRLVPNEPVEDFDILFLNLHLYIMLYKPI